MKPSKLTICGINSYTTQQTIDFKKLAEGNLFGIFGATGSGKSTILDCITIALFGTSDRDNLSNIINVNCKDAFIKFEFELERDGVANTYEVARIYRLRQSGLSSGANLINLTTNENLGDSSDIVNAKLDELLGIGKKEFLKCIALPQNEFDKFLLDTPADRKKSISKLFNLEQFGEDLNRKVKSRLDILTTKQQSLTAQLETFGGITEEIQNNLQKQISQEELKIESLTKQIETLSFELKELDDKNNKTIELIAAKNQLDDIKSREDNYKRLKISIDNYSCNKENINKVVKIREKIVELDDNSNKIKTIKLELEAHNKKLKSLENDYNELKDKKRVLEVKADEFKLSVEKKKLLIQTIDDFKSQVLTLKEKHADKLEQLLKLTDLEDKTAKGLENALVEIGIIEGKIAFNDKLLKAVHDVLLLSESENFITQLRDIKASINYTNLEDVEDYKIHKDILTLFAKINNTVGFYENRLAMRDKMLQDLKVKLKDLNKFNNELLKKQTALNEELSKANKKHAEYFGSKIQYNLDSTNLKTELQNIKDEMKEKNDTITNFTMQLDQFVDLVDCSGEISEVDAQILSKENERIEINNLINKSNAEIKALEVASKFLTDEVKDLQLQIPKGFDASGFETDVTEANYQIKVDDLNNYEKQKMYYETKVEKLTKELNNKLIDAEVVAAKHKKLVDLTDTLNALKVQLGIDFTNLDNNAEKLIKQNKIETELHLVNEDLKLTQKLAGYISKNALVDYVSEEYLYMISEYANKFVYSISRGKYMLKYSSKNAGEFMAIDNFNGGMARSIKTLSGGERFIFSLSLALGVSQSIAVNNNKSFNFFFIDEGFGNLSEDYIDDVLACFDSLIKLDFTVGFISHVEKMQEYINNKVVVTKLNNEEGSVITQY